MISPVYPGMTYQEVTATTDFPGIEDIIARRRDALFCHVVHWMTSHRHIEYSGRQSLYELVQYLISIGVEPVLAVCECSGLVTVHPSAFKLVKVIIPGCCNGTQL